LDMTRAQFSFTIFNQVAVLIQKLRDTRRARLNPS